MIDDEKRAIILPVAKGYLICPDCGMTKLIRVRKETTATRLQVYCRRCKRELIVDIREGQCFESQGR